MRKNTLLSLSLALACAFGGAQAAALGTVTVQAASTQQSAGFDAVVEAVRQTVIAAQVPGAVVQIDVKAGDQVKAGQLLMRLDARAAELNAAASDAQVAAARAQLDAAAKEYERQKQLFSKQYISQAALERAESQFKATQAQAAAQLAQAGAARTQSGFHLVRAPYAGVVAEVPVSLGDMAMPGRPLLTIYDPSQLRVSAAVPQSVTGMLGVKPAVRIELPGLPEAQRWPQASRVQLLPTVDAATHTAQIRAELPAGFAGAAPGLFARLWLPAAAGRDGAAGQRLMVPAKAVLRRAELSAVYVIDAKGQPLLRQVRTGRAEGDSVEILSGLSAGEKIALDPQAAARQR